MRDAVEAERRQPAWYADPALEVLQSLIGLPILQLYRHPLLARLAAPEFACFEDALHLVFRAAGLSIVCEGQSGVAAVQLYAGGWERFGRWSRPLPDGLAFHMRRAVVRQALSEPDATCGGQFIAGLGWKPPWDLYRTPAANLHIEYAERAQDGIRMLTVQAPWPAPF